MKKLFTSLLVIMFSIGAFADVNIYTPSLIAPANEAENQMPDELLNWGPVSGSFGLFYKIHIDTDSTFNNPIEMTTGLSAIKSENLSFGTTYFWRVKAIDNTDSSDWSAVRLFSVVEKPTLKPMMVNVWNCYTSSTIASLNAVVEWLVITGIANFHFEIDTILSFNSGYHLSGNISKDKLKLELFNDLSNVLYSNHSYYFRLRAEHSLDVSEWSDILVFDICNGMPNAPHLNLPADGAINRPVTLNLDWKPLTDAASYIVEYSTDAAFTSPVTVSHVPVSTNITFLDNSRINVSGLQNNQTYYWRVKAVKGFETTLWSDVWSFSTIGTDLSVPVLSSPTDLAVDVYPAVSLEWHSDPLATGYIIEIDTDNSFASAQVLNETQITLSLDDLTFNTEYFWRVKSLNATDTTLWSSVYSFIVIEKPFGYMPLDMAEGVALNFEIIWVEIDGVIDYLVQIDTSVAFNSPLLIDSIVDDNFFLFSADLFNTAYFWRVKAMHGADTTDWSDVWSCTTIDTMPGTPFLVSPIDAAFNLTPEVLLEWSTIGGALYYNLEYDTDALFATAVSHNINDNFYHLNDLLFGETYFWRVRAIGANDTSAWSNEYSFTIVDDVMLISPLDGATSMALSLLLKWEPVYGSLHYECEVDTTMLFNSAIIENYLVMNHSAITQVFATQDLFATTYFWRVRAVNASGASDWSTVWSFTTIDEVFLAMPEDGAVDVMPHVNLRAFNVQGVLNYQFEIDTLPTFDSFIYNSTVAGGDIPFVNSPASELLFGQKYYWRARGRISATYTTWSNVWEFTTVEKVMLLAPSNASAISNVNPLLKWDAINGVTHYVVEIDTNVTFATATSYDVMTPVKELTIQNTTLVSGKTYHWRVKAIHASDESEWSDIWSFNFNYNVGIESNTLSNSLNMYPNPSNGLVNIHINVANTAQVEIQILDITGRIVFADNLHLQQGQNSKAMNLNFLTQGIYIISVKNEEINLNKKLILNN